MLITAQGFECKVLLPYLSQPVDDVFLPYIFMEWMHIKVNLDNNCPDLEGLINQLTRAGYRPYDIKLEEYIYIHNKETLLPGRFSKFVSMLWEINIKKLSSVMYLYLSLHISAKSQMMKYNDLLWVHKSAKKLF